MIRSDLHLTFYTNILPFCLYVRIRTLKWFHDKPTHDVVKSRMVTHRIVAYSRVILCLL